MAAATVIGIECVGLQYPMPDILSSSSISAPLLHIEHCQEQIFTTWTLDDLAAILTAYAHARRPQRTSILALGIPYAQAFRVGLPDSCPHLSSNPTFGQQLRT